MDRKADPDEKGTESSLSENLAWQGGLYRKADPDEKGTESVDDLPLYDGLRVFESQS